MPSMQAEMNDQISYKPPSSVHIVSNVDLEPLDSAHLNQVHEELEKLNIATDVINKLEVQLDNARMAFREIQASWTQRLEKISKKLGTKIEKCRPYHEAKLEERRIREAAQKAAIRFERANRMHTVAKEQVSLTQDSLNRFNSKNVDPACLEVLNHHVQRVNEAEEERLFSEQAHCLVSKKMAEMSQLIVHLNNRLGRTIQLTRPYFEARLEFSQVLQSQKSVINRLETEVKQKKTDYTQSLRRLEVISENIHQERQMTGLKREQGVGCESPDPPIDRDQIRSTTPTPPLSLVAVSSSSSGNLADLHQVSAALIDGHFRRLYLIENRADNPLILRRSSSICVDSHDTADDGRHSISLAAGVILLAHHLAGFDTWLTDEQRQRAFSFPPEDADVEYRTTPIGVKPFPTPPISPRHEVITDDDEENMLRSHNDMIIEINDCAERLKNSMRIGNVSDAERESASGESSAGRVY